MDPHKLTKPVALLSAAAALLLAPNPAKGDAPLGSATVCATGTCCPHVGSKCFPNDIHGFTDYYYKSAGDCSS